MQEIITSIGITDLTNILKETMKETYYELMDLENKKQTDKPYSLNKACKILKVSNYKIRRLIGDGFIKIANDNKILKSELEKYLKNS